MKIEIRSSGNVQTIDREQEESLYSDARTPLHPPKKTVKLPLWVPAVTVTFFLLVILVLGVSVWSLNRSLRQQAQGESSQSEIRLPAVDPETGALTSPYLALPEINERALAYASLEAEQVTFITTKLNTKTVPVQYEVIFIKHGGTQYEYHLNAENGVLLNYWMQETDAEVDTTGFLSMAEARAIALECAGLKDAIFTRERLDPDNDVYCYKLSFYDAAGRVYTVHLLAAEGTVLRYEVEEPLQPDVRLISLEEAKQQALNRAGVKDAALATFTKQKRVGSVYLLAFTLEDGTQYTIELDGQSGMANTVDVVPVAADTSQFLGVAAAKMLALQKAGLTQQDTVTFTKAKIDRDSAAYVYELDFETDTYEYEVSVHAVTGEVIKYKAWFR